MKKLKLGARQMFSNLMCLMLITIGSMCLTLTCPSNADEKVVSNSLNIVLENAEECDYEKIYNIYQLDVFEYFNIAGEYDTDLKKKVYSKSEDYQSQISELRSLKNGLAGKYFFIKLSGGNYFMSKYQLDKQGFYLELGMNAGLRGVESRAPKTLNHVLFRSLALLNIPEKTYAEYIPLPSGVYSEKLFLKIDEQTGSLIENEPNNIDIYFLFNISGVKDVIDYNFYNMTEGSWSKYTEKKYLIANNTRVIVAHSQTGEIFFDKIYTGK